MAKGSPVLSNTSVDPSEVETASVDAPAPSKTCVCRVIHGDVHRGFHDTGKPVVFETGAEVILPREEALSLEAVGSVEILAA